MISSSTVRMQTNDSHVRIHCSPDVKLYDYLKEEMGNRMVDRLYDLKIEIKNAAEIGRIY